MPGFAMFKHESSASKESHLWRIAALWPSAGAHAFGAAQQSASFNRPGKFQGATVSGRTAVTLFTRCRESVGKARCQS